MITLNATDYTGKRLATQELEEKVSQAIRNQDQWSEADEDNFATFTVFYNGTDCDGQDFAGEIVHSISAYDTFQEIYEHVDDELVENADDKMNEAKDAKEELNVMNELMEAEKWDMDDVYDLIEEQVVIDVTADLISTAGDSIAIHEDEVVNFEVE